MATVEIAREQSCRSAGGAGDELEIGFGHASEVIVNDDGRNRGGQPNRRRKKRFRDAGRKPVRPARSRPCGVFESESKFESRPHIRFVHEDRLTSRACTNPQTSAQ
jgi:hypothetical protein